MTTYQGPPCLKCGGTERYPPRGREKTGSCAECQRRKYRKEGSIDKDDAKLAYEVIMAGVPIRDTASKFDVRTQELLRAINEHLGVDL